MQDELSSLGTILTTLKKLIFITELILKLILTTEVDIEIYHTTSISYLQHVT